MNGTFNVRINPALHRAARLRAVRDEVSLNEVVAAAVRYYVDGGDPIHVT